MLTPGSLPTDLIMRLNALTNKPVDNTCRDTLRMVIELEIFKKTSGIAFHNELKYIMESTEEINRNLKVRR